MHFDGKNVLIYLILFFIKIETLSKQSASNVDPNENMIARALKEQLESHIEQLKKQVKDLRDENDKQMERNHELNE